MNSDLEYIKKRIEENCNENRAIPFWSWNNDLQEDVLVKQIQDMKDAGMVETSVFILTHSLKPLTFITKVFRQELCITTVT